MVNSRFKIDKSSHIELFFQLLVSLCGLRQLGLEISNSCFVLGGGRIFLFVAFSDGPVAVRRTSWKVSSTNDSRDLTVAWNRWTSIPMAAIFSLSVDCWLVADD